MGVNFTSAGLKIKLGSQIPEIIELEPARVYVLLEDEEIFLMHDDAEDDYVMQDDTEEDYLLT